MKYEITFKGRTIVLDREEFVKRAALGFCPKTTIVAKDGDVTVGVVHIRAFGDILMEGKDVFNFRYAKECCGEIVGWEGV